MKIIKFLLCIYFFPIYVCKCIRVYYENFAIKYFNEDDYFFNYPIQISSLYYFFY